MQEILKVHDLKTYFSMRRGRLKAVDGVNVIISRGGSIGIVGESGCGKTVTALSIMGLIPYPGNVVGGQILFKGEDLLKKSEAEMRTIRGNKISMIFQDPLSSLNPVIKMGEQIAETIRRHSDISKSAAWNKAVEMMELVGIPEAEARSHEYPFQFSGGMRQRVMIAIALSCGPELIIADEPTTNLDVTVQAQIVDLLDEVQRKTKTSIMLITHNLGLVSWMSERIYVMYAGRVVESATREELFKNPLHPYTSLLLKSIPKLDEETERLATIKGMVPSLIDLPPGCKFYSRCPFAMEICRQKDPQMIEVVQGHNVSCFLLEKQ